MFKNTQLLYVYAVLPFKVSCSSFPWFLINYLPFLVCPLLPIHFRYRRLSVHMIQFNYTRTHTHSVGLFWTRDRPVAVTST
jgi:hypothetical protein